MENAGLAAAAAIYREKAGDWPGARALWSRLAQVVARGRDAAADAYNGSLVQFNLARSAKACGDEPRARDALVAAVRLLEEAADEFESRGLRERAFDCFQVLVEIGRAGGQFEHVLEGYINCIRILREDHLKYYALQFFEDAVAAAREAGELAAAATIAREASDYARSLGMASASAHYVLDQATLWRGAAQQHETRGAPPEIAENSMLAAILAYGQLGKFAKVGELYRALGAMDLEASRKAHYARAAHRYDGVADEEVDAAPIPQHLRRDTHAVDVWHVDLVEWEQGGSAAEACADVLLDERWSDPIRRRAMIARLTALGVPDDAPSDAPRTQARVKLAEELGHLSLYAVLAPLEHLFERPEPAVKLAVLAAMQSLHFKRTFITLSAGLRDADPRVVDQAARSAQELVFPHAFDPLARIVREAQTDPVRGCALQAIARIDTPAAAEFLLGILEHGGPRERTLAAEILRRVASRAFLDLARASVRSAAPELQTTLRELLKIRGIVP
jgi:hypothetical protein